MALLFFVREFMENCPLVSETVKLNTTPDKGQSRVLDVLNQVANDLDIPHVFRGVKPSVGNELTVVASMRVEPTYEERVREVLGARLRQLALEFSEPKNGDAPNSARAEDMAVKTDLEAASSSPRTPTNVSASIATVVPGKPILPPSKPLAQPYSRAELTQLPSRHRFGINFFRY